MKKITAELSSIFLMESYPAFLLMVVTHLVAHVMVAGPVHVVVGPGVLGLREAAKGCLINGGASPGPL